MNNQLIELSNKISEPGSLEWEEAITIGQQLRQLKELSQWAIGDLANRVASEYGDTAIGKFSYAIGLERKTVREYMRVSRKYQPTIRMAVLSFRHHQIALQSDNPKKMLVKANDKNWTTRELYKAVKEQSNHHHRSGCHHSWVTYQRCLDCGLTQPIAQETHLSPERPANHISDQSVSLPEDHVFLTIRK